MKKTLNHSVAFFAIVFAFNLFLTSCGKDDNNLDSQSTIVGKWKITTINETLNGKPVEGYNLIENESLIGNIIEFNSNLSFIEKKGNVFIGSGTYTTNGGTLGIKVTGASESDSGTFTISNNNLHIYKQYFDSEKGTYVRVTNLIRIN